MDEIQRKIEDFQKQLLPPQSILKQTIRSSPALLPAIGLIIGLVLQYYFNLPLFVWFGILFFSLILLILQRFFDKIYLVFISVSLCFVCLGGIRLLNYDTPAANDIRNIKINDFTFTHIKARIISEPRIIVADGNDWLFANFSQSYPYTTFYAKVTDIKTDTGWQKTAGKIKFYISEDSNNLNAGDIFQSFCRLEKFSPADNPCQFDTAKFMNRNGVFLSASVKSANALNIISYEKSKLPFNIKTKIRQYAIAALLDNTESENSMHLVEALVLGSRTKIDRRLYNDFIKTGLVHLVALSGLNIGILAGCFWWLTKKIGLLHRGRAVASIIAAIIFLLAVPPYSAALRAGIMFITFCLGQLFTRRSNGLNNLSIAAVFLLLIRPMDFLDAGFQLSFMAVLGILFFYEPIRNFFLAPVEPLGATPFHPLYPPLRMPLDLLAVGFAAWLSVAPIIAFHFHQFQLFAAIWTVPASVPVTVTLILGTLKILLNPFLPTLAFVLGHIIDFSAKILSFLVTIFAKVPFSGITIGKFSIYIVLLCYLLVFFWKFFPFKKSFRNLIYPVSLSLIFISIFAINKHQNCHNLQLTVLSIGHGQAAFVRTPENKNFIVDAGSMSKNNIGDTVVNPFLDFLAINKIDYVFISHDDIDHYNGIPEILNNRNANNIYTTEQFIQNAPISTTNAMLSNFVRSKGLSLSATPQKIPIGKTTITRLWPLDTTDANLMSDNASSLVLLLEYADRKILFCSDIEKDVQFKLINLYPDLDIDILLAPHHGSKRTTDSAFIDYFKPEYLITSCSAARPASVCPQILEHAQSYLTCNSGAITLLINPRGKITLKTFK